VVDFAVLVWAMAAKVANKTDLVLGSVLKTWKRTFVGRNKKLVATGYYLWGSAIFILRFEKVHIFFLR
jgi:hypothetical protein